MKTGPITGAPPPSAVARPGPAAGSSRPAAGGRPADDTRGHPAQRPGRATPSIRAAARSAGPYDRWITAGRSRMPQVGLQLRGTLVLRHIRIWLAIVVATVAVGTAGY